VRDQRSSSQILFGFLPNQTVDVRGSIWKVREWRSPRHLGMIDAKSLVKELKRAASAWRNPPMDGGFCADLERGHNVHVMALDRSNGVTLEPYPPIWYCKSCRRIHFHRINRCACGSQAEKSQLHFVAFHDACGTLKAPRMPRCPQHNEAQINFPGTANAREISFKCPKCAWTQRGFPHTTCTCGQGPLTINVHRSSSVYTPRNVVIVNPPKREDVENLHGKGGAPRALSWVLGGMRQGSLNTALPTASSLKRQLQSQGLPEEVVDQMVQAAVASGKLEEDAGDLDGLDEQARSEAEDEAFAMALAAAASRRRIDDLVSATEEGTELGTLYRVDYPRSMERAHFDSVELIDRFPVLTGHFGYTRGDPTPGASKLMTYKDRRGDSVVYGDLIETEALFFRLSARKVADWLVARGHRLPAYNTDREARIAIISQTRIPPPGAVKGTEVGDDVLSLVHSLCHRVIRVLAVRAGIERSGLSEYLVPIHLGFYVYAAVRGDFVLGGLQAVFESELDGLLDDVVHAEQRCALDPGCANGAGACMSCLHLGEPSCRYWNTYLNRGDLFGRSGFYGRR
jgi:hypothetical protein